MSRFALRLLILAMYATALGAVSLATPAVAVTNGSKEIKKHGKMTQRSPAIHDRRSDNPFPPMYDDPDRRAAGGGY